MAIVNVTTANTFEQWRVKTNEVGTAVGNLTNLTEANTRGTDVIGALTDISTNLATAETTIAAISATYVDVAGDTMTGDLNFNDNVDANFGTGADLKITHNGTNTSLTNITGQLRIGGNDLRLQTQNHSEDYILCVDGGAVTLHYNDNAKIATTNTGVDITGNIVVSGTVDGRDILTDGTKLDLIEAAATADQTNAEIRTAVEAATDSNVFTDADHTLLNSVTASFVNVSGDTMTGDLNFGDDDKIKIGAGNDLQIYHDGSNSYITESGTGSLYIRGTNAVALQSGTGETYIQGIADGAVSINYNNSQKFATTNTGVSVTGTITPSGQVIANSGIYASGGDTLDLGVDSVTSLQINDADQIGIGVTPGTYKVNVAGTLNATGTITQGGTAVATTTYVDAAAESRQDDIGAMISQVIAATAHTTGDAGTVYQILTMGNTDFELFGAPASHAVNTVFTSTNVAGLGTGTMTKAAANSVQTNVSVQYDDANNVLNFITPSLLAGDISGNAATLTVNNEATDTTNFVGFYTQASGSLPGKTNSGLTFNSATAMLTATGVTAGALTVDNIGINANTITSTGTLVVDSNTDIILDADGGDIQLQDAGVDFGKLSNDASGSAGNFVIKSQASNKDIIFKGSDGGSEIAALTLDMSEAGKATFNSTVTANAGVIVDNITIDGTEIDLSSGDLLIDVAADIILDADGGEIVFKDGGTQIGYFSSGSSDFIMHSSVNDKDIIFKGVDNNNSITALTLDMSLAGKATFNSDVVVGGDLTINGTTTSVNSTTLTVDDKNIELGTVATPTDATANLGGITLKGTTDKTILWVNSTDTWDFNQAVKSTNGFIGDVTGDISGNAATITTTANNSTNETTYLTFVDGATGTQGIETDTGLTYNPSSGILTSTNFTGALTGNADTATTLATGRTLAMTGEVTWTSPSFTGSGNVTAASTIASNIVDEDNLKISNAGSNGQFLSKQSGNSGGLTWAVPTDTTYSPGALLDFAGATINVDLSELTDGTDAIDGNDELVYLDNGSQKRKAFSEITLSDFNDDISSIGSVSDAAENKIVKRDASGWIYIDKIFVGENSSADSEINFYDDNSNTTRTLKWDDSSNEFQIEDNGSTMRTVTTDNKFTVSLQIINSAGSTVKTIYGGPGSS